MPHNLDLLSGDAMDSYRFEMDESLRPSVERKLTGTTKIDSNISEIPLPKNTVFTRLAIILLRTYRRIAPTALRCRCVLDPSCSHYSELAFRQYTPGKAIILTAMRLRRCSKGAGGIDFSFVEKEMANWNIK